jgi:predicted phosphoribosyltransferase
MLLDKITTKFQLRLKDRSSAGNILGEALRDVIKDEKERKEHTIVLGIPRGGVILADVVAKKLSCKFDIIIPRKLRAPHNEEIAIGALMEDGTAYLNDDLVRELGILQDYIEKEKINQIQEIRRRTLLYCNHSTSKASGDHQNLKGNYNNIILVDDGAATGATIIVAARWIKKNTNITKLIIAVPIIPKITKDLLEKEADHVEVIIAPSISKFKSVGQYYQSFEATSDDQVIEIINKHKLS